MLFMQIYPASRNFARLILRRIREKPQLTALIIPTAADSGETASVEEVTFEELGRRVASIAVGLDEAGFEPGHRVVLMFPVCVDLYAAALAMLCRGLAVVLVDTGMGARRVLAAVRDSGAEAVISVDKLLRHRFWLPALWRHRKYSVDSSGPWLRPFEALVSEADDLPEPVPRRPDDHALITFTSGSTGRPRGADRTHGLLEAQHLALKSEFPELADDIDMPCFPVVALHNLCCGITTVMPPVDLSAPAAARGDLVAAFARRYRVTRLSGAPAYLERLVRHLEESGEGIPTVRELAAGGAPVSGTLCARIRAAFPRASCRVVYGSTEAEPMTSVDMDEAAASSPDRGCLVGRAADAADLAVVNLPEPLPPLDEREMARFEARRGEAGEVVVAGPHVVRGYLDNPDADRESKIPSPGGRVWHRTGDVGYLDEQDRLWLLGRNGDVVNLSSGAVHPLPLEARLDAVPGVARAAFVAGGAAGDGTVFLAVEEGEDEHRVTPRVRAVLVDLGLDEARVRPVPFIPVDRRHNSKIDRPALREPSRRGR